MGLALAMVIGMVDLSPLAADARTTTSASTITAFDTLPQDIREQQLPIGAEESDINFPTELTATLEQTVSVDKKEDTAESPEEDEERTDTEASEDKTDTKDTTDSGNTDASKDTSDSKDTGNSKDTGDTKDSGSTTESKDSTDSTTTPEDDTTTGSGDTALSDGMHWTDFLPHKLVVQAAENHTGSGDGDTTETPETKETTETVRKKITLENIKWKLDTKESDAQKFDSTEDSNGFCYVYTPVLPDTDQDGNKLVLGENVDLPAIYVLVGEYGVETLEETGNIKVTATASDGTVTEDTYADLSKCFSDNASESKYKDAQQTEIQLLANDESCSSDDTVYLDKVFGKDIILDLNGHNLTSSVYFTMSKGKLTIQSSESGGSIQFSRNVPFGITIESGAECIVGTGVTISGDAESATLFNGGTCTIKKGATISNTSSEGDETKYCAVVTQWGEITTEDGATLQACSGKIALRALYSSVTMKGGIILGKFVLENTSTATITGGTFKNGIDASQNGKTLSDLMASGYILLKTDDNTEVDLSQNTVTDSVYVKNRSIIITKQPTIPDGKGTVMEYYTEAPVLTVEAKDATNSGKTITYQWYRRITGTDGDGTETVKDNEIKGETQSTYQIPTGLSADSYTYFCRVTCGENEVDSDIVTFAVTQAAVKIIETKEDGSTKETYYENWGGAISYLAYTRNNKFEGVEKAEIILLKDTEYAGPYIPSIGDDFELFPKEIRIRSQGERHKVDGKWQILNIGNGVKVSIQNVQLEGGIQVNGGATLTLDEKTKAAYASALSVVRVNQATLILEGASVSYQAGNDTFAAVELTGNSTLYINKGTSISGKNTSPSNQVKVTGTDNTVLLEKESTVPVFYGTGALTVYCNNDKYTETAASLANVKGDRNIWCPIILPQGITLPADGENATNVTTRDNTTYGLADKNGSKAQTIKVPGEICSYQTEGGSLTTIETENLSFTMPCATVTLNTHKTDDHGSCSNCGRTDLVTAYQNGHLAIEGLTGRTYDSYPQILSKITWTSSAGKSKALTAPQYGNGQGTLGFGGENPVNSDADYTVVYKNNVQPYTLKEGDTGFDKTKAPQVTITGKGNYFGSLTICFTIGKGEMRLGDFEVCGANAVAVYNGNTHQAWNMNAIEFKPDEGDKGQFPGLKDGENIRNCTNISEAEIWFGSGNWTYPNQIEYSTDDQKTWIMEREFGASAEQMYMLTDAGEYPFYIRVTNEACGTVTSGKLTAKITPRDLSAAEIALEPLSGVTAYYTGSPILPTNWDEKITDSGLIGEFGKVKEPYTLVKGKDFTVSGSNNTEVTDKATVTFTGTGNYTGTLSAEFAIAYAFTTAQTTGSKTFWYNQPVQVQSPASADVTDGSAAVPVLYTTESKTTPGESLAFYDKLEDAVNGTNPVTSYQITGEGEIQKTLYIKDSTGYVGKPVEVTVHIDTTAPTWQAANGNTENYGINIKNNWWRTFLNKVSFGHLYNEETLDVQIRANDAKAGVNQTSGVDKYYYYIQEITDAEAAGEYTTLTAEQLEQLSKDGSDATQGFVAVEGNGSKKVTLQSASEEKNYVIYAYAVDKAGNVSTYVCSEGIVQDTAAPIVQVKEPQKADGTLKDTELTLKVNLSEDATLMWFFVSEGVFRDGDNYTYEDCKKDIIAYMNGNPQYPQFAVLQEDGKWVPRSGWDYDDLGFYYNLCQIREKGPDHSSSNLDFSTSYRATTFKMEGTKGENTILLGDMGKPYKYFPLYPSKKVAVWVAAIDKAGNITAPLQPLEYTTTKAMPRVTTDPALTGVYGDTPKDLTVTAGVAEYNGQTITGTWKVTDPGTSTLEVGTTETCEVTFTADTATYGDIYEDVILRVTPTIEKRPITIKVQDMNMTTTYGEELPQIPDRDIAIVVDGNGSPLVGSDTVSTIASTLTLVTQAKKGSNAGTYDFTLESNSPNYAVTVEYYGDTSTQKDTGTLTIAKAKGEMIKGEGFNTYRKGTYRDAAFSLLVTGNHNESKLVYTVHDSADSFGTKVADDQTIVVDSDGKVTGKNAGTAEITISLPESTNYTAAEPVNVFVDIGQSSFSLQAVDKKYLCIRENADTIDIASMLPKDCGEVRLSLVDVTPKDFFSIAPAVEGGKLSYTVKEGTAGETSSIIVDIQTNNYGIVMLGISLGRVDQKPVGPIEEVTLVSNTMTYGESLSSLHFNEVTFVDAEEWNTEVSGTLAWSVPDDKPAAGEQTPQWKFTPDHEEYAEYSDNVKIIVNKADPDVVRVPEPEALYYSPEAVSNAVLNSGANPGAVNGVDGKALAGSWSWVEVNLIPTVGTGSHRIVFTPDDTANYNTVERTVTLTVKQAIPYITVKPSTAEAYTHGDYLYNQNPTGGKAVYGDGRGGAGDAGTLAGTEIPGTFTWKNSSEALNYLENRNGKTYEFIFTPEDTALYETVTGTTSLTVSQAAYPPLNPAGVNGAIYASNSCEKVGDVELPRGWKWTDADTEKELEVGTPQADVKAEYTGADAGNYQNTQVSLTVYRTDCKHEKTETVGAVKATCTTPGNTGAVRCLDCGVTVTAGYPIPKDADNHTHLTSTVLKQPTTTAEGLMEYSCSDCGYTVTKAIAKLTTGGNTSGGSNGSGSGSSGSGSSSSGSSTSGGSQNSAGNSAGVAALVTPPAAPVPGTETVAPLPETRPTAPARKPSGNGIQAEPADDGGLAMPFLRNEDGKEGWDVITDEAAQAEEGETLMIDMNGATVVPADVFEEIQGRDITIEFDLGNGITWKVNGQSVQSGNVGDIDFGVKLGADANDTIPVDVINNITGERMSMNLSLAYDGEFGFQAVLNVNIGSHNAGLFANLFYYNERTGKLEFICAGEIGADGSVDLTFSHASEYTIVIDAQSMEQEAAAALTDDAAPDDNGSAAADGTDQSVTPANVEDTTTSYTWLILLAALAALALSGIALALRHRKESEE